MLAFIQKLVSTKVQRLNAMRKQYREMVEVLAAGREPKKPDEARELLQALGLTEADLAADVRGMERKREIETSLLTYDPAAMRKEQDELVAFYAPQAVLDRAKAFRIQEELPRQRWRKLVRDGEARSKLLDELHDFAQKHPRLAE